LHASAQSVTGWVIGSGGGSSVSAGGCLKMNATFGQPVAGSSSGGNFTLKTGYWAGRGDPDSIFRNGLEVCS
jgi:hypothetical protein